MDLHLVLKGKYFDEIVAGLKPEEYRANTVYWRKRICGVGTKDIPYCDFGCMCHVFCAGRKLNTKYKHVVFHRAYTNITAKYCIAEITVGVGNPEWGSWDDAYKYIIKLGDRIQ